MDNMDIILISTTLVSCVLFLCLQRFILKYTNKLTSYYWLVLCAILIAILNCLLIGLTLVVLQYPLINILFYASVSLCINLIVLAFYLLTFYSYTESSITIKLLSLIAQHKKGITVHNLQKLYNKEVIINRRLNRLETQHALLKDKNDYILNTIPFMFKIRRLIQLSIFILFPKTK